MNESVTTWNLFDVIAAVLLIGSTAYGFHRGFIRQLLSVTGFVVAYLAAFMLYDDLAPWIAPWFPVTEYAPAVKYEGIVRGLKLDVYLHNAIAFAVLFFGVKITLTVAGHLLDWLSRTPGIHQVNRWTGAVLAMAEMALMLIITVHVMQVLPAEAIREKLEHSIVAQAVLIHTPEAASKLANLFAKSASLP